MNAADAARINSRNPDVSTAAMNGLRSLEQASLPTGLEWKIWSNHWLPTVEQREPWQRAIVDAIRKLQSNQITLARMVRREGAAKNMIQYNSEGRITGEELRMPGEITREALVWFIAQVKPVFDKPIVPLPDWASILCRSVEGCFLQQARLGIELDHIKAAGYLTLNHSATSPSPDAFDAMGSEQL